MRQKMGSTTTSPANYSPIDGITSKMYPNKTTIESPSLSLFRRSFYASGKDGL